MWPNYTHPVYGTSPWIAGGAAVGIGAALFVSRDDGPLWRRIAAGLILATCAYLGARALGELGVSGLAGVASFSWLRPSGQIRLSGAVVGVLVGMPICHATVLGNFRLLRTADVVAVGLAASEPIFRLGCFATGCCFGRVSHLVGSVTFPAGSPPWQRHVVLGLISPFAHASLPVYPLQLYFCALALLCLVAVLEMMRHRSHMPGLAALVFVAMHEWGKFWLETLREPAFPGDHSLRIPALIVATLATLALLATLAVHASATSDSRSRIARTSTRRPEQPAEGF